MTGVGAKRVRFREIPDEFFDAAKVGPAWDATKEAWKRLIARFREFGILSNDPMPTEAALVTIISLIDKFKDDANFKLALYWFIQASRFNRYSASGTTTLEEDLRDIQESGSLKEAVEKMLKRFPYTTPFQQEDFLRDYTDGRFGRFMLYLLVYRNKAMDWDEHGHRLGFEGVEVLSDFRPQWHHIFPKKYLEGNVNDTLVDAIANIAVIGPEINIRISAKDPLSYVEKYKITKEKLGQQFIGTDFTKVSFGEFEAWLKNRAQILSDQANEFLRELRGAL